MFSRFVPGPEADAALYSAPHDPQLFQLGVMSPPAPPPPPIAIGVVDQYGYMLPAPGIVQTMQQPQVPVIGQPVGSMPPGPPRFVLQVPADATAMQRTWPMRPSTQTQVWTAQVFGRNMIF